MAKTVRVPEQIPKRGIAQYVAHEAEELERRFKNGYAEDGEMLFEVYAKRWIDRQVHYAPSTGRVTAAYWSGSTLSSARSAYAACVLLP